MVDRNNHPALICLRVTLGFINILYLLFSAAVISLGVFIFVNQDGVYDSGNGVAIVAGMILLIGLFVFLLSILGLVGVITNVWPLLVIYCFLLTLLLAAQVTITVLAFVYRPKMEAQLNRQLLVYIKNYTTSDSTSYNAESNGAIDLIQSTFHCCGQNGFSDWIVHNPSYTIPNGFPASCSCVVDDDDDDDDNNKCYTYTLLHGVVPVFISGGGSSISIWKQGCNQTLHKIIDENMKVFGGLSGAGGAFLILTFLLSMGLAVLNLIIIKKKRRYSRLQNATNSSLQEITYTAGPVNSKQLRSHIV